MVICNSIMFFDKIIFHFYFINFVLIFFVRFFEKKTRKARRVGGVAVVTSSLPGNRKAATHSPTLVWFVPQSDSTLNYLLHLLT